MRHTQIDIYASALNHNLQQIRQMAPAAKIVSMVKANAYGHGIAEAAAALANTDAFGVASMQEALDLRALGYHQPITLIEGIFQQDEWQQAIDYQFDCLVHHSQQISWALANPQPFINAKLKLWVKVNTGMNRLGFTPDQAVETIDQLRETGFEVVLTTHFANADQPQHPINASQIKQFLDVKNRCEPILASCCNSAALAQWPELHFDYVRPGIMLYGATPFATKSAADLGLKAAMRLSAKIIRCDLLKKNDAIGYASLFRAKNDCRIGIVSIGYGDGYPRTLSSAAKVWIDGYFAPIIGRISMDMLAIDLTHLPSSIGLGQTVELWGENLAVDDVAICNNTIGYELLCRLTQRPNRIFHSKQE